MMAESNISCISNIVLAQILYNVNLTLTMQGSTYVDEVTVFLPVGIQKAYWPLVMQALLGRPTGHR